MFMKECKTIQKVIFILAVICVSITQSWADSWKEIFFADPTIFVENGKYYLTGTRNREPQGFAILESTDLKHWTVPNGKDLQLILRKGDQAFGEKGFWAPQYFKDKRTYYLLAELNYCNIYA